MLRISIDLPMDWEPWHCVRPNKTTLISATSWSGKKPQIAVPPWCQISLYSEGVKAYWGQWNSLEVRDGVLY